MQYSVVARQREYHDHPERFVSMDKKDLDNMLHELNEEVRKKASTRPR